MSDLPLARNHSTLLGIALFSMAMLFIPVLDSLAKYLTTDLSPLYIAWTRYLSASIFILPIAFFKFGRHVFPKRNIKSHFTRTFLIISAMLCYFIALSTTPLATATAVTMTAPIIATIAAVFILKERLTVVKVFALLLGFGGAMIITQPSMDMEIGLLFAFATGLLYGLYMVATRMTSRESDPVKTLCFQCVVGMLFLLPLALPYMEIPTMRELMFFAAMGFVSVVAHGFTIAAFQYAQASTLSPFIYLEIVSAVILGFVIFGDVPTLTYWIGAAVIVVAGLLISFSHKRIR